MLALTACGSDNNTSAGWVLGASAAAGELRQWQLDCAGLDGPKNAMAEWIKNYQGRAPTRTVDYSAPAPAPASQAFTRTPPTSPARTRR